MPTRVFDAEGALNRLGGDQELLNELVQFFLEDVPVLLDQIRDGLRDGNAVLVERGAHSLKGLSANFGAQEAVDAALAVEQFGRDGDLSAAAAALPRLEQNVGTLLEALNSYRQSSGS